MNLSTLRPAKGSRKARKRVGRGPGSGNGTTAGRGNKGHQARSGYTQSNTEGGQMPLHRRLPKFGFTVPNAVSERVINVGQIEALVKKGAFGNEASLEDFKDAGIVGKQDYLKVLGQGELTVAITVTAHSFSESAKQKIEKAGGKVVIAHRTIEEAVHMKNEELQKALLTEKVSVNAKKAAAKAAKAKK